VIKDVLKDVLKGAGLAVILIGGFIMLGWGLGMLAGKIFATQIEHLTERPVWYCIEGKVYEKISDTYITVVPSRTCLPVIKE